MRAVPVLIVLMLSFVASVFVRGQNEKSASELGRFEVDWLTAILNDDRPWLDRFTAGKFGVVPGDKQGAKSRADEVRQIIDPDLSPKEMKVRIVGTVSLLTSDTSRNRSFDFLDTFNKHGNKWEVIATHFSPAASATSETDQKRAERELLNLENEFGQAAIVGDRSVLDRIIAPDFVGASIVGALTDKQRWPDAPSNQRINSTTRSDLQVRVYSDSVAVVTGIDNIVESGRERKEITHQDRFTHTWLNRNGQWQLIASQATRIK
jgi:Domain of unknown function (DUF4440)